MESADYHDGTYPVQTLYFSCLNYLRINYKLINFTLLNDEIAFDMVKIIEKHDHLKKYKSLPFRRINNFAPFNSYIYKHCNRSDKIVEYTGIEYVNELRNLMADLPQRHVEYISGIVQLYTAPALYDSANGKFYRIRNNIYWYERKVLLSEIEKIFPEHNGNESTYYKIYSEDYFDQYPGMAKWAESTGYISRKLWIPENLVTKC